MPLSLARHLFQNRFLSKPVETREYLMQVCRYIHQNPVKAGISKVDDYNWSSYKEYTGGEKIVSTKLVLSLFGNGREEAIDNFRKFHNDNKEDINDEYEYELNTSFDDNEAKNIIRKVLNVKDVTEIKRLNMNLRNEEIEKLKIVKGISKSQISRVLELDRKIIERILN